MTELIFYRTKYGLCGKKKNVLCIVNGQGKKAVCVQEHHWFYTLKVRVFLGNNTVMFEN